MEGRTDGQMDERSEGPTDRRVGEALYIVGNKKSKEIKKDLLECFCWKVKSGKL